VDSIQADQLADAVIVILVFIAALINRWEHRKTRRSNGPNGPLT
jgi:hypothetical protein